MILSPFEAYRTALGVLRVHFQLSGFKLEVDYYGCGSQINCCESYNSRKKNLGWVRGAAQESSPTITRRGAFLS